MVRVKNKTEHQWSDKEDTMWGIKVLQKIGKIIFPFYEMNKANKSIKEKEDQTEEISNELEIEIKKTKRNLLEEEYRKSIEVKTQLDDKLKILAPTLTVTITLVLNFYSVIDYILEKFNQNSLNYFVCAITLISIIYMTIASIMVVEALVNKNIVYSVNVIGKHEIDKLEIYEAGPVSRFSTK